jgi:hypothetical protein
VVPFLLLLKIGVASLAALEPVNALDDCRLNSQPFIGRSIPEGDRAKEELENEIKGALRKDVLKIIRKGDALTGDYRTNRAIVSIEHGVIQNIDCK